ncbi:2-phosphosulfolactate phosphatase [Pedosphaera parvula]|uniref:Probable 2-phosphosulfolactate phosphatase n=1 Tax=Pedosphaera parvula (strain Ellin514) TaxID=320771 RepID=B9XGL3_PEDPL|nr:2-phosphosulfolactate phosphatase [Pedosphaera parvula]EEF61064.1 2-phosphosulfolactate phosphatase [Pedosphaera parvula Ellin514]
MSTNFEVLFAPAEFDALSRRDLSATTCVVFDVFRATSTIVTALAHGANALIPVSDIPEALSWRQKHPEVLLAGERDGLRIQANLTGGIDFDLGNSPREFTPERIRGHTIVISTTNGSRALRACTGAQTVLVGSLLNLTATSDYLRRHRPKELLLVCSGTGDQASFEDILGVGALVEELWPDYDEMLMADSVIVAHQIYLQHSKNLLNALKHSRNGRRLLAMPDLREDVPWCLQKNVYALVAALEADGKIKATFR